MNDTNALCWRRSVQLYKLYHPQVSSSDTQSHVILDFNMSEGYTNYMSLKSEGTPMNDVMDGEERQCEPWATGKRFLM